MPTVSVILTSYNHADYLPQSIESILTQTFTDFELIIVDDCSQDTSWDIISSYNDSRIHARRLEKNSFCSYLPATIQQAEGMYIAIAHCDDYWAPDKLEKQLAYLQLHPETGACFTQVEIVDEAGSICNNHPFAAVFSKQNRTRFEWLRYFFDHGGALCHPSILIRKQLYALCNLHVQGLSSIPDFCQWIRLCSHCEIYVYPQKLTYFRAREKGKNTSGDEAPKHYRNATELFFVLREYIHLSSEELIQVFPEVSAFRVEGVTDNNTYLFARFLLTQQNKPYCMLLGMQLLYELFQVKETRDQITKGYGYTLSEFSAEKTLCDVFSLLREDRFLTMKVYVDTGAGFTEEESVEQRIYIHNDSTFLAEFTLPSIVRNKPVRALRLLPDQGYARRIFSESILLQEKNVSLFALNAIHHEGWDNFFSFFPVYEVRLNTPFSAEKLVWEGKAESISIWDIHSHMEEINTKYAALLSEKETTFATMQSLREENEKLGEKVNRTAAYIKQYPLKAIVKIILHRPFFHND